VCMVVGMIVRMTVGVVVIAAMVMRVTSSVIRRRRGVPALPAGQQHEKQPRQQDECDEHADSHALYLMQSSPRRDEKMPGGATGVIQIGCGQGTGLVGRVTPCALSWLQPSPARTE
jgi:hypothetical protein